MLPIKAVGFGTPKAALSRAARRSSQTDAKRRFRRAGRLAAASLSAAALALVGASTAAAALLAYVSKASNDSVLPINLSNSTLEAGINVGEFTSSIAIPLSGPLASLAYTPLLLGETLIPINLKTGAFGSISLGGKLESEAVAITPNGEFAYVIDEEFKKSEGAVSVVKLATNEVLTTIPVGEEPEGIAFTLNGELAYVADKAGEKQGLITVIEKASTASPTVMTSIKIGTANKSCLTEGKNPAEDCVEPEKIAVSGLLAYVADGAAGAIAVINTATNKVVEEIAVGDALVSSNEPDNIAITPNGLFAYATDGLLGKVDAIEIANNNPKGDKVVATIPVGSGPHGLAITADGKLAVVTDEEEENVKTINTATNLVANTFLVLGEPDGVAITP